MAFVYILALVAFGVAAYLFYKVGWKAALAALMAFGTGLWLAFAGLWEALVSAGKPPSEVVALMSPQDNPLVPILLVIGIVVGLYTAYRAIRYFLPGYGTLLTNALTTVGVIVGVLSSLPWSAVLHPSQIGFVTMGLAIVNAMMRVTPTATEPPMAQPK